MRAALQVHSVDQSVVRSFVWPVHRLMMNDLSYFSTGFNVDYRLSDGIRFKMNIHFFHSQFHLSARADRDKNRRRGEITSTEVPVQVKLG